MRSRCGSAGEVFAWRKRECKGKKSLGRAAEPLCSKEMNNDPIEKRYGARGQVGRYRRYEEAAPTSRRCAAGKGASLIWRAYKSAIFSSVAVTLAYASPAGAIDTEAGDYIAQPPGTSLFAFYHLYSDFTGAYNNGHKTSGGSLSSDVEVFRMVHYTNIGGVLIDPQFALFYGREQGHNQLSAEGRGQGFGGLLLEGSAFLVNSPETSTYFAITPFLYLPTGSYNRDRNLNIGENRWKFALQAGYTTPLSERLSVSLLSDVTFFGHNDDYGPESKTLTEKPLFSVHAWLLYQLSSSTDLRFGSFYSFGSKQSEDGQSLSNRQSTLNFRGGIGWRPSQKTQLVATVGRDASVENGLYTGTQVNLRFVLAF